MNDRDIRRYQRATRVVTFGQANDADFTADSLARVHRSGVAAKLADLDLAKAGPVPARVSKSTLLDALVLDFLRIADTAEAAVGNSGGW